MCAGLTWTGVGFEVVGLGLVAVELTRVQRRDLGTPRWMQRAQNWWRRLRGRPGTVYAKTGPRTLSASASLRVRGQRGPGATVEERVASLAERRDQLRESVTLQWWGTRLFVIGAVLTGLANTC